MASTGKKEITQKNPAAVTRVTWLWYALLLIPFIVYLKGLAPSIVFGDTGDYLTAGWIQGVAHPPGYPLFTILTGLFERLPIPPVWIQTESFSAQAWRGNLLSMLFGIGTLGVLFALVYRISQNRIAAMVSSGALAFSWVFWWHSEVCENDTMSTFLLLSMFLLAVRYVQEKRWYDPYLLALVIGTGIAHHHVLIIFTLPVLFYMFSAKALGKKFYKAIMLTLILLIGLLPVFYLPLTNYKVPENELKFTGELTPAQIEDLQNEDGRSYRWTDKSRSEYFWDYILRKVYSRQRQYTHTDEALGEDYTTTGDVDLFYSELVLEDFGPILPLLGLGGLASCIGLLIQRMILRRRKAMEFELSAWCLVLSGWVIYFLLVNFYPSGDILRAPQYNLETAGPGLMLPLEVFFSVYIGLGTAAFFRWLEIKFPGKSSYRTFSVVILIVLIGLNAIVNYPRADKSHHTIAHEYAVNVLDSCPENSILVTAGDEMYVFYYMRYVHPDPVTGTSGYRQDVKVIPWSGMLGDMSELSDISSAMTNALVSLINSNPDTEIGTTFMNSQFLENETVKIRTMARRGLVFSFIPETESTDLSRVHGELVGRTGLDRYEVGIPETYKWHFWDYPVNSGFMDTPNLWPPEEECRWRLGETLLFYGIQELVSGNNEGARIYFERLIAIESWNDEAREYLTYATGESDPPQN